MFFYFLSNNVFSQRFYTLGDDKHFVDSVTRLVNEGSPDSIRCLNLFKLSDLFRRNKNSDLYKIYLKRADSLSSKFPFLRDLSVYYNASYCLEKGDLKGYEVQLLKADKKLSKHPNSIAFSLRAFIHKNLAVLQQMKDDEKTATRILIDDAIPLAKKSGDFEVLSNVYVTLGIIFMNNANREKADQYLKMAIQSAEKANPNSYQLLETKLQAYITNAENATQLSRERDAEQSLDKAYSILKNYPESNLNGIFYQAKGLLQFGRQEWQSAMESYDLGIKNCYLHHDNVLANSLRFLKVQALNHLERHSEARDLLIGIDQEGHESGDNALKLYRQIILNCDKVGDVKTAYKYSKKYIHLADSLYQTNSKKEMAELEAKYNTIEKENEINQLEATRQRGSIITQRNYILFTSLSVVLLLIVVLLWKNTINQKKLSIEIEKNYHQNLVTLKNQKEVEVLQATISGEEKERQRIARDLHDGVGSHLSALKMRITRVLNTNAGKQNPEEAALIMNTVDNAISELRQVAYNLVPETLLKLGLEHALNDLCHSLRTPSVSIVLHANGIEQNLDKSHQMTIFRIVQELINNAMKHSKCSEIIVDCSQNQNLFLITVEDNGVGFAPDLEKGHSGLGLKNLRNRVNLLNGKMEIQSSADTGTIYDIELKVELSDEKNL